MGQPRRIPAAGERFNRWTVLGRAENNERGPTKVRVECDCGTVSTVLAATLYEQRSKSCGCLKNELSSERASSPTTKLRAPRKVPAKGERFNRLVVLGLAERDKNFNVRVWVQCDCGNVFTARATNIRHNQTKSCGCLRNEMAAMGRGLITRDGVTMHLTAWCRHLGMKLPTVLKRVERGATLEEALTRPLKKKGKACSP